MSRYSRKPPIQPRPAAPKPEPTIPEGKQAIAHIRKPGWLGYIHEIPWNSRGVVVDVMWVQSPTDPTTEKPYPLPIYPQRYPSIDLIVQSTPKSEDAISADILGQEGEVRGDRVALDPQEPSWGKNQPLNRRAA